MLSIRLDLDLSSQSHLPIKSKKNQCELARKLAIGNLAPLNASVRCKTPVMQFFWFVRSAVRSSKDESRPLPSLDANVNRDDSHAHNADHHTDRNQDFQLDLRSTQVLIEVMPPAKQEERIHEALEA